MVFFHPQPVIFSRLFSRFEYSSRVFLRHQLENSAEDVTNGTKVGRNSRQILAMKIAKKLLLVMYHLNLILQILAWPQLFGRVSYVQKLLLCFTFESFDGWQLQS